MSYTIAVSVVLVCSQQFSYGLVIVANFLQDIVLVIVS